MCGAKSVNEKMVSKRSPVSLFSLGSQYSQSSSTSFDFPKNYYDDDDDDDDDNDDDYSYSDIFSNYFDIDNIKIKREHDAINLVLEKEAYCFDFSNFAQKLVDAILIEAIKIVTHNTKPLLLPTLNIPLCIENQEKQYQYEESLDYWDRGRLSNPSFSEASSLYWPKISEFNIKLGLEKVENYVRNWERSSDWEFCVEFLGFECEDCSNIFVFEVEWSKPTKSYPIPQTTASVYFALEVFKMVPHNHDRSVEVTYIFECSNVVHYPGKIDFQEKWLEDIIEAKKRFFKTITFSESAESKRLSFFNFLKKKFTTQVRVTPKNFYSSISDTIRVSESIREYFGCKNLAVKLILLT